MKDPVCQMNVSKDSKHHLQHESQDYYFCSEQCLNKFRESPKQYLTKECCGHCDLNTHKQDSRNTNKDVAADAIYTCPMHPEIIRDEPGSCPICGMSLESMAVEIDSGAIS